MGRYFCILFIPILHQTINLVFISVRLKDIVVFPVCFDSPVCQRNLFQLALLLFRTFLILLRHSKIFHRHLYFPWNELVLK